MLFHSISIRSVSFRSVPFHYIPFHSFFFFKQKTAYEIGDRLVGSEMCIRDRLDTMLDGMSEKDLKILSATAKGIEEANNETTGE